MKAKVCRLDIQYITNAFLCVSTLFTEKVSITSIVLIKEIFLMINGKVLENYMQCHVSIHC